jgi:hypothetical protein
MLGQTTPTGPIGKLAEAMVSANYEGFEFNLKDATKRLGDAIALNNQIAEQNKKTEFKKRWHATLIKKSLI